VKRALFGPGAVLIAIGLWSTRARATDFHVAEAVAGSDLRGRSTLGLGYTLDALITTDMPQGLLLGGNLDALFCHDCDKSLGGAWLDAHLLVTFWKDDLSVITPYIGLAGGPGYSVWKDCAFGQIEGQIALQSRALYQGWWIRPIVYAGYSGAYDVHAAFGLRIAIGYALNHGSTSPHVSSETCDPQVCPRAGGPCDIPQEVSLSAASTTVRLCNCSQAERAELVKGGNLTIHADADDLIIDVGPATPGTEQSVKIDIGGGRETVTLKRRDCPLPK
jgi:hypothetical protein